MLRWEKLDGEAAQGTTAASTEEVLRLEFGSGVGSSFLLHGDCVSFFRDSHANIDFHHVHAFLSLPQFLWNSLKSMTTAIVSYYPSLKVRALTVTTAMLALALQTDMNEELFN